MRRVLQWIAYSLPVALFALEGWTHRFVADDGFIYFRVVQHVVHGHGPVFNSGHRVEAFTSPLWVALLAGADLLTPIRLEWIAVLLGVGLSVAGLGLAVAGSARLACREVSTDLLVPLGALGVVAVYPMWLWQTGGLETGLVIAWLGLSLWLLARWASEPESRCGTWAAVLLGLGWVVRPEFLLVSVVFIATVLAGQWRIDRWPSRIRVLVAAGVVPVAYEVFRMGYYGLLVSNTAIAKEGSRIRVDQGWRYLLDFSKPYALWLVAALLILGGYAPLAVRLWRARQGRAVLVLAAFLTSSVLVVVAVVGYGGDYLHGRLLVPATFALCAPVAVIRLRTQYLAAAAVAAWAVACGVWLRPPELRNARGFGPAPTYFFLPKVLDGRVTLDQSRPGVRDQIRAQVRGPGVYVQSATDADSYEKVARTAAAGVALPAVVMSDIGARGYAIEDMFVLDVRGLADPLTAHLQLVGRGYPGHEKGLPSVWAAAVMSAPDTNPRESQFVATQPSKTTPGGPSPFAEQLRAARRALQCPALRDLQRSTTRRLSVGAFMSNVIHSFSRTTLRIPSDPVVAEQRLCRPSAPARSDASRQTHHLRSVAFVAVLADTPSPPSPRARRNPGRDAWYRTRHPFTPTVASPSARAPPPDRPDRGGVTVAEWSTR